MVRKVVGEQGGTRVVHQQSVKLNTPVWQSGKPLPSPVWNSKKPLAGPLVGSGGSGFDKRSGTELWGLLKPRLGMMVKLQKQWGNIHHLYEAKRESLFEDHVVPRYIRDPDSASVAVWDLIQVRTTHARTRSLFFSLNLLFARETHDDDLPRHQDRLGTNARNSTQKASGRFRHTHCRSLRCST